MLQCYEIVGPPSVPSTAICSLSYDESTTVSITWPLPFTSEHAVERYRVAIIPDPSLCFSDQASPSLIYTCSGLAQGETYMFEVSAFNCGDQEGERETFTVKPESKFML